MKQIQCKIGDTAIRRDGLKGKIKLICDCGKALEGCKFCKKYDFSEPIVVWENGQKDYLPLYDTAPTFSEYYLIGHNVFGNKATEEELEQQIADKEKEIQQAKKEKDQLRKQLWRLKEEMVEDWRERKALRELRKQNKENQSTEEDTED